jgi:hypothetical protein
MVVHTCNPSYEEGEDGRMEFKSSVGKKVSKTLSQKTSQAWWCMSVMSATQATEVGGLRFEMQTKSKRTGCG